MAASSSSSSSSSSNSSSSSSKKKKVGAMDCSSSHLQFSCFLTCYMNYLNLTELTEFMFLMEAEGDPDSWRRCI